MHQVFEHLLFMPEMLDERNKWNFVTAMLQFEAALSTAQADIGPIPASTAQIIRGCCRVDAFDVLQLLANRRRVLGDARIKKNVGWQQRFQHLVSEPHHQLPMERDMEPPWAGR